MSLCNTPSLRRMCLEACDLRVLDISESPRIGDLRVALNENLTRIRYGAVGKHLWHLCTRDNSKLRQSFPIEQFTAMKHLFIWNDNQSGVCEIQSRNLAYVDISRNRYTGARVAENPDMEYFYCSSNMISSLSLERCGKLKRLDCSNNRIKGLDISGCPGLAYLDAHHNLLTRKAVDDILKALVGAGRPGGTCILAMNSPPSRKGRAYREILLSRGWNVEVSSMFCDMKYRARQFFMRSRDVILSAL